MTSRIITRAGRDAPKYVQAFLRQAPAAASTEAASAMLMSQPAAIHGYSYQQSTAVQNQVRFFSDSKATPPPPPPPPPLEEEKPADAAETEEAATPFEETEEAVDGDAEPEPELTPDEMKAKIDSLEAEVKEIKTDLLRSLAEQDNTRRIAQNDIKQARQFAVKSFAKSLLEVSDNLSRALGVVPEEMRKDTENHATLATLYEGIQMTETGLTKAFESNGLTKYGVPGDAFDPNIHSALYEYPDPEKEPGTVGQVIKVGYMLNDRVLRPADVGVVKKE